MAVSFFYIILTLYTYPKFACEIVPRKINGAVRNTLPLFKLLLISYDWKYSEKVVL